MRMRLIMIAVLTVALGGFGCGKQSRGDSAKAPPAATEMPAPPTVKDGKGPYVLRYFSPTSGDLIVAREVSGVPEAARKQVLVVPDDPAKQGAWLFVADLSAKDGETYPVRVVDRFELERTRLASAPVQSPSTAAAAASAKADEVILYKTVWCGYCHKAGEYLRLKGVQFVEKDIERDPGARQDMLARAQKAGVPSSALGGVPILYIKGQVLTGFNREAIDRALGG